MFIDEAYLLVDGQNILGVKAIDMIVQEMESHRNDMVVIMEKRVKEERMELAEGVKGMFFSRVKEMDIRTGNCRFVRILLECVKIKQAGRILSLPEELQVEEIFWLQN